MSVSNVCFLQFKDLLTDYYFSSTKAHKSRRSDTGDTETLLEKNTKLFNILDDVKDEITNNILDLPDNPRRLIYLNTIESECQTLIALGEAVTAKKTLTVLGILSHLDKLRRNIEYLDRPERNGQDENNFNTLDDIFLSRANAEKAYSALREKDLIDEANQYINRASKAAFCVWFKEIQRARAGREALAKHCKNDIGLSLMNAKFKWLDMAASNFTQTSTIQNAENKYLQDFIITLSRI
jgi:hypothetical protein